MFGGGSAIREIVALVSLAAHRLRRVPPEGSDLHSAKGGAVETGCSDLYDVIY